MPSPISDELRAIVIRNLNRGKSIREVAEMTGCSKDAVHRVKKCYDEEGRTVHKPRGGPHAKKLDQSHVDFILGHVDTDCTITLAELRHLLNEQFGIAVSLTTISKSIR